MMYSFTAKRVTWKKVMISSWTGLILPRTAPKATQVDATQKSASMMLSRDRPARSCSYNQKRHSKPLVLCGLRPVV